MWNVARKVQDGEKHSPSLRKWQHKILCVDVYTLHTWIYVRMFTRDQKTHLETKATTSEYGCKDLGVTMHMFVDICRLHALIYVRMFTREQMTHLEAKPPQVDMHAKTYVSICSHRPSISMHL